MDNQRISDQKSRVIFQGADGSPEVRAVGPITIFSYRWDRPVCLDDGGYFVIGDRRPEQEGRLRDLQIFPNRPRYPTWATVLYWALAGLVIGSGLTRLWFLLAGPRF